MKINEVIDSGNLESIVVESLNNVIDGLFHLGHSFDLMIRYATEYFVNNYKHNIFEKLIKPNDETKEIHFTVDISTDENEVRFRYNLDNNKLIVYIRLFIDATLINQVINKIVRLYLLDKSNIYKVLKTSTIRSFIEIQVHELTHVKQYVSQINNNDFDRFHKMVTSKNSKKELIKKSYLDNNRHFLYPNEMNAYVSEISSRLISNFVKEETDTFNTLSGLPFEMYKKDVKNLYRRTLHQIPSISKQVRKELNSHEGTPLLKTAYKQIAVSVSKFIEPYVEKRMKQFKELEE